MKKKLTIKSLFSILCMVIVSSCSSEPVTSQTIIGKWEMTDAKVEGEGIEINGQYIEFYDTGEYCRNFPMGGWCGGWEILENGRLSIFGPNWISGEFSTFYSNIQELDVKFQMGKLVISTPEDKSINRATEDFSFKFTKETAEP